MTKDNQPDTSDELEKDLSDIIEFPQLAKGSIATQDLRGQPMSSTELGHKVSMIMERVNALIDQERREAEANILSRTFIDGNKIYIATPDDNPDGIISAKDYIAQLKGKKS